MNLDNLEYLPQLPENWVESLHKAGAVANNGKIVVLDALHIQQWPTVEHKPKLMTELVAAVHEMIRGVSESVMRALEGSFSTGLGRRIPLCVLRDPFFFAAQPCTQLLTSTPGPTQKRTA